MKKVYIAIAIFMFVVIVFLLIKYFINKNWILVYTVFGNEDYYKMMSLLKEAGITYKVVKPDRVINSRVERFNDQTKYQIYVKKGEEYQAEFVLHKRK